MATTFNQHLVGHAPAFLPIFGYVRYSLGGKEGTLHEGDSCFWVKHGKVHVLRASERSALVRHTGLQGSELNITLDAGWTHISNGKWQFSECNYESHIAGELIRRVMELHESDRKWVHSSVGFRIQTAGITMESIPRLPGAPFRGWAVAHLNKVTKQPLNSKIGYTAADAYQVARQTKTHGSEKIVVVYNESGHARAAFFQGTLFAGG